MGKALLALILALPAVAQEQQKSADGQVPAETERNLKDLLSEMTRVANVTAVANEISLVVVSIGKDKGVKEGDELSIYRGSEFVAKLTVDRVDRKWAAGKIGSKRSDPRVGDNVASGAGVSDESRKGLLDHALSFRPVTGEDRARVTKQLEDLDSDEIETRVKAVQGLVDLGGPAKVVLKALDLERRSAEVRSRVREVLDKLETPDRLLQSAGLERDVEFLAFVGDPRAHERLKRILAGVKPFSVSGVPEPGPGLDEYLKGWWAYSRTRVRWNAEADRFEEK